MGEEKAEVQKKKVLGTAPIIAIAMALIGPAAYGIGFFPAMIAYAGPVLALPVLIGTMACIFTAISIAVLAMKFAYSGGVYAYSREAAGVHVGFMVGWAAILAYFFLPAAGALFAGVYGAIFITSISGVSFVGLDLIVAIISALAMLFVAYRGIAFGSRTMITILIVQILLVFIIALWALSAGLGTPGVNAGAPFDPKFTEWALISPTAGNWGAIATAGFTFFFAFYGFDGTVVFAGEAKSPYRSCALGAILCILIVGAIYVFWSWAMMLPYTADITTFTTMAMDTQVNLDVSYIAGQAGVAWLGSASAGIAAFSFALLLSAIGSGTAAALTISRILNAMGKDEVMPKSFGKLHPKHASPYMAAILVGIVTLLFPIGAFALGISLVTAFLFTALWCAWGVLVMYFFVNIDNILISRKKLTGKTVLTGIIVPIVGAILMAYIWLASGVAGIPGIPEASATAGGPWWNTMMLPGIIWMIIGLIYLIYLHAARHEVLERGITAV